MRITAKTDIGKGRAENQDNYRSGVFPNGVVWGIVCDGMGGGQDGKLASTLAADCMEDVLYTCLQKDPKDSEIEKIMVQGVELANEEIYQRSGNGAVVMGTTLVSAVVRDQIIHVAHAGDSRAYLYEDGILEQLTHDHSMVQEMVDMGYISPMEAENHPEKNVITRALGVGGELQVEYTTRKLNKEAILLLCTDGLSNMVSAERMAQILEKYDFYDASGELIQEALLEGGNDNITVLLMQLKEAGADE